MDQTILKRMTTSHSPCQVVCEASSSWMEIFISMSCDTFGHNLARCLSPKHSCSREQLSSFPCPTLCIAPHLRRRLTVTYKYVMRSPFSEFIGTFAIALLVQHRGSSRRNASSGELLFIEESSFVLRHECPSSFKLLQSRQLRFLLDKGL